MQHRSGSCGDGWAQRGVRVAWEGLGSITCTIVHIVTEASAFGRRNSPLFNVRASVDAAFV
jgi:hypothetical protein